jgi:hypothetical protein
LHSGDALQMRKARQGEKMDDGHHEDPQSPLLSNIKTNGLSKFEILVMPSRLEKGPNRGEDKAVLWKVGHVAKWYGDT